MYTVYKVINKLNQKYYIGVHKTDNPNDSYLGSGVAIRRAITKYGADAFEKEILHIFDTKEEAFGKEKELTVLFFKNDNYNLKLGGQGGFTVENARKGYAASASKFTKEQLKENGKLGYAKALACIDHAAVGKLGGLKNKGVPKTEEWKNQIKAVWEQKRIDNHELYNHIRELKAQGLTGKAIADMVGLSRNTVMKYWK